MWRCWFSTALFLLYIHHTGFRDLAWTLTSFSHHLPRPRPSLLLLESFCSNGFFGWGSSNILAIFDSVTSVHTQELRQHKSSAGLAIQHVPEKRWASVPTYRETRWREELLAATTIICPSLRMILLSAFSLSFKKGHELFHPKLGKWKEHPLPRSPPAWKSSPYSAWESGVGKISSEGCLSARP